MTGRTDPGAPAGREPDWQAPAGSAHRSQLAGARAFASGATMVMSLASLEAVSMLARSGDPLDDLLDRVRPQLRGAVDALQVAAALEADGVTDRVARVQYGYRDVFELASEVFRFRSAPRWGTDGGPLVTGPSVGRREPHGAGTDRSTRAGGGRRDMAHGALYLLPSAVFPAVLAIVDPRASVLAVALSGGLGWFWAGIASWVGYQLAGVGERAAAGRALCWASGLGVLLAAGLGTGIALATSTGPAPVALAAGVMAYQMASTLLMFYRHEYWLAVVMAPAVLAGTGYVVLGRHLLPWALACGATGVVAALAAALLTAYRATRGPGTASPVRWRRGGLAPVRSLLRTRARTATLVCAYGGLSAALLLHAQVPYLSRHLNILLTMAPLIVSMGFVEWRARRFGEQARQLLVYCQRPAQFVTRMWLLLAANVLACCAVVAVLGTALLLVLHRVGMFVPPCVPMTVAYTVLAGAYLLTFQLAEYGRYGRMCLALAAAVAVHIGLSTGWPDPDPQHDATLFAGSVVLLHLLLLAAVAPAVGQVWRHR